MAATPSEREIVCPRCGNDQLHRSRARALDFLFSFAGLRVAYRCGWCRKRFFAMYYMEVRKRGRGDEQAREKKARKVRPPVGDPPPHSELPIPV